MANYLSRDEMMWVAEGCIPISSSHRENEGMVGGDEGHSEILKLPEACISHAISFTSPRDSCRSAVVSTIFRSAADSDTVWNLYLPNDYEEILGEAYNPVEFSSKKDLYVVLCNSILIDDGKKSFSLERWSGRKCYTLSVREMEILSRGDLDEWRWMHRDDSRFQEVCQIESVLWPDIRWRMDSERLSRRTNYAAYLIFKVTIRVWGFAFPNLKASVCLGNQTSQTEVGLAPEKRWEQRPSSHPYQYMIGQMITVEVSSGGRERHERPDGWMEMELGEFFSGDGDDGELEMRLWETEGGRRKCGLIIEGIEVRPK